MNLKNSSYDRAAILLFGIAIVIFLLTFRDYGYSWDEVWQTRWYGQAVLRFLLTFGADLGATNTHNFYLYGGLFDTFVELIPLISPVEEFVARRFANISIGLLAMAGAWKTARMLAGPRAAFWTLLFLLPPVHKLLHHSPKAQALRAEREREIH